MKTDQVLDSLLSEPAGLENLSFSRSLVPKPQRPCCFRVLTKALACGLSSLCVSTREVSDGLVLMLQVPQTHPAKHQRAGVLSSLQVKMSCVLYLAPHARLCFAVCCSLTRS